MQLHEMWMTRLTVRWLGVQRYDKCASEKYTRYTVVSSWSL